MVEEQSVIKPQSAKTQEERIDFLRRRIGADKYAFVRKELLVSTSLDLTHLFDPQAFARNYAYRDPAKDERIGEIRTSENRYQTIGLVGAVPFVILSAKRKDVRYFLPGLVLIGGFKYYSGKVRQQMMKDSGLEEYWKKSRKLEFDLKKTEHYIETRKLLEK